MKRNLCFAESLIHAAAGVFQTLRRERNFRIHLCAAALVIVFAYFFGLEGTQWAVLTVTIAAVLAAELLNTAVEHACDAQTMQYSEPIKLAKDMAAGAVLLTAAGALAVGICLFGDVQRIAQTLRHICANPVAGAAVCAVFGADILLLAFGGKNSDK